MSVKTIIEQIATDPIHLVSKSESVMVNDNGEERIISVSVIKVVDSNIVILFNSEINMVLLIKMDSFFVIASAEHVNENHSWRIDLDDKESSLSTHVVAFNRIWKIIK